jgi:hypothetical protein
LIQKYQRKFNLYKKIAFAKSQSQSLNHFTILSIKALLDLKINKGEKEAKSYIDLKCHFKEEWPFMWQVTDVKSL